VAAPTAAGKTAPTAALFAFRNAVVAMPAIASGVIAGAVTATVPLLRETDCCQRASACPAAMSANGPAADPEAATAVTAGWIVPAAVAGAARFSPMSRSG
jgi:hypothetical protein